MFELILQRSGSRLLRWPVIQESLTIGRASDNTIVLLDEDISRHHCQLELRDGALHLADLSTNGTLVNNAIAPEGKLVVGDKIAVGPWTIELTEGKDASPKTVVCSPAATKVVEYDAGTRTLTTEEIELVASSPECPPLVQHFSSEEILIGQHAACDLALADPYISRRHCRITNRDGALALLDLGSTNGTFMGGERIERASLPPRGSFQIGRSTIEWRLLRQREELLPAPEMAFGEMIGPSPAMREVFALIERIAPSNVPVCITGESGTGKELVARELHARSARREGPFVAVNCGAFPASLIESQLFGHERGAFTGAEERTAGLFEQARGGTLLLDEIGEMPLDLQARLLRVLETKRVRRVGGQEEIPVDVRILAATHRDLKTLLREGKFREDLFFRLHVIPIRLPPLRERPEDIRALALQALAEQGTRERPCQLTSAAMAKLVKHPWPGNVRELKNALARSCLLAPNGMMDAGDILLDEGGEVTGGLREQEREILAAALKSCGENVSRTARRLGIARTTLQKKLRRHDIYTPRKA